MNRAAGLAIGGLALAMTACSSVPTKPTLDLPLAPGDNIGVFDKNGKVKCVFERASDPTPTIFERSLVCDPDIMERFFYDEENYRFFEAPAEPLGPLVPASTGAPSATEAKPLGPVGMA